MAQAGGWERRLAGHRAWLIPAGMALSVLLMDGLLQLINAQRAPQGLFLLGLRRQWRDPWQRGEVLHSLCCYVAAALIAGLATYALLPEPEADPQAADRRLGRQVIEASVADLKRRGALDPGHELGARRRFWWQFWQAARRDRD